MIALMYCFERMPLQQRSQPRQSQPSVNATDVTRLTRAAVTPIGTTPPATACHSPFFLLHVLR
jgi:hypothetical protein